MTSEPINATRRRDGVFVVTEVGRARRTAPPRETPGGAYADQTRRVFIPNQPGPYGPQFQPEPRGYDYDPGPAPLARVFTEHKGISYAAIGAGALVVIAGVVFVAVWALEHWEFVAVAVAFGAIAYGTVKGKK